RRDGWPARGDLAFELRADVGAQCRLGDLPDLGPRQRVDEFETFGPLVLGQALSLQVGADAGECRRVLRVPGHDVGAAALAQSGVGHADQGDLGNGGVTRDQELDLFGVDLLAAAVDEVLDTALDRVAQLPRVPARLDEATATVELLCDE